MDCKLRVEVVRGTVLFAEARTIGKDCYFEIRIVVVVVVVRRSDDIEFAPKPQLLLPFQ